MIFGGISIAALLFDLSWGLELPLERFIFIMTGFWFGPSCGLFLGASRIINSRDHYGPGTLYPFDKPWPYAVLLTLMGVLDFALVIYKDSHLKDPPEIKDLKRESQNSQPGDQAQMDSEVELLGKTSLQ